MGDRIETGTFCVAATLAKGDLVIKNFNPNVIQTELNLLKKVGAKIKTSKNEINIKGPKKIKNFTLQPSGSCAGDIPQNPSRIGCTDGSRSILCRSPGLS